ncbi:MAG: AAA family ATPase [Bacteroidales bacterium]
MIVSEMKKRSKDMSFPSVMIFGGASGTGKTTMALLLGALINDPNPIVYDTHKDPNPESPEYKAVYSEVYNRNVCFYDASKMGKEEVLGLEDVVSTKSIFGGTKVLIIDEAQELGKHSKGAILKLLEKKRDDICIILCTMNPESFDKSMRSRGQYYQFKSPSCSDIASYLFSIVDSLGIKVPDEFLEGGLFTISENCEGSVRMAVQTLERCLTAELYSSEAIQKEFGFLSSESLFPLVKLLLEKNPEVFKQIKEYNLKDFFYQSNKVISDSIIFLRTGIVDAEWKTPQYEGLKKYTNELKELFNLYSDIDKIMGAYFKNSYCLVRLTEFLDESRPKFAPTPRLPRG